MKPFLRRTVYTGPVQAVILDWAGTAVDHGCRGPVAVFSRAFERHGITPEVAEVRAPMGCEKREHVRAMLAMPRLAELWRAKHGHEPDEAATDAVFATVQELMPETLADYATPRAWLCGSHCGPAGQGRQTRLLHRLQPGHDGAPHAARRGGGL